MQAKLTTRRSGLVQVLLYVWASPASCLGLLCLPLAVMLGGSARRHHGVLEVSGGLLKRLLGGVPWLGGVACMTLGHVVIGRDDSSMDVSRAHERVHVRQYERWGPLFIPAYLLSSLWIALCGRHAYRDNPFEVEARRLSEGSSIGQFP